MARESKAGNHGERTMATASRDGNRVGAIIQSMFARIKKPWVRVGRESSDAESVAQPHARQAERQLRYANLQPRRNWPTIAGPHLIETLTPFRIRDPERPDAGGGRRR
jgi:hypothetical protein